MNPYNSCVMNKMVDGKQCTIFWQVDDIKILHLSLKLLDRVLSNMTDNYRKLSPLSVS